MLSVKLDLINYGLFDFALWVTTIVMLSLSIVWGLVSIGFTAFNILGKPIETITGPMSLYLWNGLACEYCGPAVQRMLSVKAIFTLALLVL